MGAGSLVEGIRNATARTGSLFNQHLVAVSDQGGYPTGSDCHPSLFDFNLSGDSDFHKLHYTACLYRGEAIHVSWQPLWG